MKIILQKIFQNFLYGFPLIALFLLTFTGFDFSFVIYETNFSFNFAYLIIFFWVLKKPESIGFGLIFFAGIINDVVQNFPIGITSVNFLLLCAVAAFVRNRILVPNILYDWVLFLMATLIVTSINYSILTIIFDFPIKYGSLMASLFISFLFYPIFSYIFNQINLLSTRQEDAE